MAVLAAMMISCATPQIAPTYPSTVFSLRKNVVVGIIGDTQRTSLLEVWRESNNPQRELLLRQLARKRPDALIHLGDMVFYGSYADDWVYFDSVMAPVRQAGIALYPILGNHEYFGSDDVMLQHVHDRFPEMQQTWYSTVIDSVGYVFLNTNYRDIGMKTMEQQRRWFLSTMHEYERADSVLFVVVCGHHPPYTNSTVVDDEELLQQYFLPVYMLSRKGAVWFSGHSHAYEHFYIDMKHFVVSGGGGGPRQRMLTGEYEQHLDMYDQGMVRPFHYCTVERSGKVLHVAMHPLRTPGVEPFVADSFAVARP